MGDSRVEDLLREVAPQVLGALVRRSGDFAAAEDAVQEALLAAAQQWPEQGLPSNPRGWLLQVASRRLVDEVRAETARRRREEHAAREPAVAEPLDTDDSLRLLFLCCHPDLPSASAVALTLRSVAGLTTGEIAAAFLVPEATMAQRISRAKQTLRAGGAAFRLPAPGEYGERLAAVLRVLYLVFTEGHTTTAGSALLRTDLVAEAVRLTRDLHAALPHEPEVAGLLALLLLTHARSPARSADDGSLVPLAEQDRSRWDAALIAEGVALLTDALPRGRVGPYQLQAAISAVHDEAASTQETDWPQILALYGVLERVAPGPVVALNRVVALAMVQGPAAGLAALAPLEGDRRLTDRHRLPAVRGFLLERAGDRPAAAAAYRAAAGLATSTPERDHLRLRAAQCAADPDPGCG